MSRISAEDFERLLERICKDDPTLTRVDLNDSGIGDADVVRIAEAFAGNTHVTVLGLWGNNIGDEGARALAGALHENSAITNLDLRGNNIGDEGAESFVDALHENSAITYLGLWETNIDDDLYSKLEELVQINGEAPDHQEARRRKIEAQIDWMLDPNSGEDESEAEDEDSEGSGEEEEAEDETETGAAYEAATSLALAELGSFPEASRRRGLFRHLLGSTERGAAVAAAVDAAQAKVLYRYAAECSSAPAVLKNLLQAHPSLCTCRDVKEKLYPFMLLATVEEAEVGDVMEALLANPSLVKGGIAGPAE